MSGHEHPAASTRLLGRLQAERERIRVLTAKMPPETATPYFEDIDACIAEYEQLREQVNSGRRGREVAEGLPEGTLPRV